MNPIVTIWTALVAFAEWLCGPLAPVGMAIKTMLTHVPPWAVRGALAAAFLALTIWCLTLSKKYVMEDAERVTRWNDPRRWAAAVLAIQIALYLCL